MFLKSAALPQTGPYDPILRYQEPVIIASGLDVSPEFFKMALSRITKFMGTTTVKYDAIFAWKMNVKETAAYKVACVFEEEVAHMFPDEPIPRNCKIPQKNDPRKGELFRHCWAFLRETRGILEQNKHRLYIKAQLLATKKYDAYLGPSIIRGDKSWIRWKVYERWYKRKELELQNTPETKAVSVNPKIVREIDRTKKFVFEMCEGEPTYEKLQEFFKNGMIRIWAMSGKLSYYYVVCSPYLKEHISSLEQECCFDSTLYLGKMDDDLTSYFNQEFIHEFKKDQENGDCPNSVSHKGL